MAKENFWSTSPLEKTIVNRKHDIHNNKVNWLELRQIRITKEKPYSIFMNKDFDENFVEVNIQRRTAGRPKSSPDLAAFLVPLWPNGKPVSLPKLQDIKSIMHLIPGDARQFYENLTSDPDIVDDVDGIDGTLDFTLE